MIPDQQLTAHFTLYELTKTDIDRFQEENRNINPLQISKLVTLAKLLEHVRYVLGEPLIIHSGYRCPDLNQAVGSSTASQHRLCEAADFTPTKMDINDAFQLLQKDLAKPRSNVGQLIFETAGRPYGVVSWLHISLGIPYRDIDRCNQVLTLKDGIYTRIT